MEDIAAMPSQSIATPAEHRPASPLSVLVRLVRAARGDASARRARRVVLMLVLLWIINMFDLSFTMIARQIGGFVEANPVAAHVVRDSLSLVIFKLTMLVCATLILFTFRRHLWTEVGCWLLAAVYTTLAFVWHLYYLHVPIL